jgi:mRNA deadenylase 3'-5' endonuclease subunit Ccr4
MQSANTLTFCHEYNSILDFTAITYNVLCHTIIQTVHILGISRVLTAVK